MRRRIIHADPAQQSRSDGNVHRERDQYCAGAELHANVDDRECHIVQCLAGDFAECIAVVGNKIGFSGIDDDLYGDCNGCGWLGYSDGHGDGDGIEQSDHHQLQCFSDFGDLGAIVDPDMGHDKHDLGQHQQWSGYEFAGQRYGHGFADCDHDLYHHGDGGVWNDACDGLHDGDGG